jgi:DNA polymerase I
LEAGRFSTSYRLITDSDEALRAVAELAENGFPVGLDLETTGLDPLTDRARLLQLAPPSGPTLVIDLAKVGGLEALAGPLGQLHAVAHNAIFEMSFLSRAGVRLVPDCTMLAGHALTGQAEKLSVLAERHLGLSLDKAEQKSDWSGALTERQLRYAALDAGAVGRCCRC